MAQKVIDVVGTSKESFAKAAENAVAEAAKTVRGMKWARVAELEMEVDGKEVDGKRESNTGRQRRFISTLKSRDCSDVKFANESAPDSIESGRPSISPPPKAAHYYRTLRPSPGEWL
jgi:flavin-binding protein dodecin